MLFNSGVFLKFFAAFLLLYWLVRRHLAARNVLIVAASYLFYGWWDWRFLSLLLASSLMDYAVGRVLARRDDPRRRKVWLALSLTGNLTMLGFFKYYGFFAGSMAVLLDQLGVPFHPRTLAIVLPVGISFYTFQTMSYVIDVYRRELPATRNLVNFLAYVSFFPQLVAGPIERGKHLQPQFERALTITGPMLEEGVWLMLWGMFKKVALADNLAPLVDLVFQNPTHSAPAVVLGTLAFAFQIYGDFSGYSDIARGVARVLGFDLRLNFNLPYSATSPREFWRRWHISLSTWLRDYLYIGLGGSRRGPARTYLNLLLTMLLGGLWHGAAWNFVLWGLWHAGGLMAHRLWISVTATRIQSHTSQAVSGAVSPHPSPLPKGEGESETAAEETGPPGSFARGTMGSLSPSERAGVRGKQPHDFSATGDFKSPLGLEVSYSPVRRVLSWVGTMLFVLYGWLLFRARSFDEITALTTALGHWTAPAWIGSYALSLLAFSLPLVLMDLWQHGTKNLLVPLALPQWAKVVLQGALLLGILFFWQKQHVPFIYFQF